MLNLLSLYLSRSTPSNGGTEQMGGVCGVAGAHRRAMSRSDVFRIEFLSCGTGGMFRESGTNSRIVDYRRWNKYFR